jgi:ribosomal protein S18 acetylase RimI-like enzyme
MDETEETLLRCLGPADAARFMSLRRAALEDAPFAFSSSPEDDRARSVEFVRETLASADQAVLGAFAGDLVGMVGISRERHVKTAHICGLWGLYVTPAARSAGVGRALVRAALSFARSLPGVTHVSVGVTERAPDAASLYRSIGFVEWGVEPAALRVGDVVVAESHLVLAFESEPA